jgi:hypothetical protein
MLLKPARELRRLQVAARHCLNDLLRRPRQVLFLAQAHHEV